MKPSESSHIEKDAYAYLIANYISHKEGENPRIILLGFSNISEQICQQLSQKSVQVIQPENTGRLKEASLTRRSNQACVILIRSRKNLGKFASLLTAYRVLDEVIVAKNGIMKIDMYNLRDVASWLINTKNIKDTCVFIAEKLSSKVQLNCEGIVAILKEIENMAQLRPSFTEWLHPQRIVRSLINALKEKCCSHDTSVASFLRSLGIEPIAKLEMISSFSKEIEKKENLESLKKNLSIYPKMLNLYYTCSIPRQRTNLANLCLNHCRNILCSLASKELKLKSEAKWIEVLNEFERVIIIGDKRKRPKRKYRSISKGTRVYHRSRVSGLPIRFQVVLEANLENGDRNLLQELHDEELNRMLEKYSDIIQPERLAFQFKPVSLTSGGSKLTIELEIVNEKGITLDPYINGSKTPTRKINRLLADIRRRST